MAAFYFGSDSYSDAEYDQMLIEGAAIRAEMLRDAAADERVEADTSCPDCGNRGYIDEPEGRISCDCPAGSVFEEEQITAQHEARNAERSIACGTCGLAVPDGTCPDCDPNGDAERAHLLAMAADAALFDAIEAARLQQNAEADAERAAYNEIVNYGREVREQRAERYADALNELRETPDREEMHASDVPVCPTCGRFPIDGATFLRFGYVSGDCCDSCATDATAFWRKLSLMLNHELANFARREYGMRLSGSRKKMIGSLMLAYNNTNTFLASAQR